MIDFVALAVTLPLLALVVVVGFREHGNSAQATVPAVAAAFLVLVGAIGGGPATDEIYDVGPTVVFLSLLLVLGHLADAEGVFAWAAASLVRRADRSPVALLRRVFVLAAATTAVLSVDVTVLLLTPIVVTTVGRMRLSARPHTYACGHLAHSASLLMPVSNLTNLLAFAATGLSFLNFTALMALPWLVAVIVEYAVLRRFVAADLSGQAIGPTTEQPPTPRLALAVLALTVVGFAVCDLIGLAPVWSAAAGVLVIAMRRLINRTSTVFSIMDSANVPLALFVLGLAVIVRGIRENGIGELISVILPSSASLGALLAVAGIAALLANLVSSLPAALVLLPTATLVGTPAVMAVLIGCNVGSNLTYIGSVANVLWRRILESYGQAPSATQFSTIGLLTVPLTLISSTTALWVSVHFFG